MLRALVLGLGLVWMLSGCNEGQIVRPAPPVEESPSADRFQVLPFEGSVYHLLVDDVDGDGRKDLAVTNHGGGYTQVLFQRGTRRFEAGPISDVVGFHPDDLVRLPGSPPRYLVNAEGIGRLRVLRPDAQGRLAMTAETALAQPASTALLAWPGWGLTLAVSPFGTRTLSLLRDFDPDDGKAGRVYSLRGEGRGHEIPGRAVTADFDGDGVDELYYATRRSGELWRLRAPAGDAPPRPELIAKFEEGNPREVYAFDIDADGELELVVPYANTPKVSVLERLPDGGFVRDLEFDFPVPPGSYHSAVGRDGDGTRYLATGAYRYLVLYRFVGPGLERAEQLALPVASWPSYVVLDDLDGDGALDLVAGMKSATSPSVVIYGPLWERLSQMVADGTRLK